MAVYYLTTHTMWCTEVYWKNCLTAENSTKALFSENAAEVEGMKEYFGCCFRSLTENTTNVLRMNKSLGVTLKQKVIFISTSIIS
jgi:hypothetical protein